MTHPALANPFDFGGQEFRGVPPEGLGRRRFSSLPSGESEPSVTLAYTPAENRFQPDLAALAVELDPPPLFLRGPRPTFVPPDDGRSLLAILKVIFGVTP
jgi:hypothetical protein